MTLNGQLVTFDKVFDVIRPNVPALKQREYLASGSYPVIDQGADLIGGFTDDENLVVPVESPHIVFGDHTMCVKWVDFNFVVGADGTKLLRPLGTVDPRFAYYQLASKELPSRGYARHFALLRKEKFWVPPLDVQQRIVEKLENHFSRLDKALAEVDEGRRRAELLVRSIRRDVFSPEEVPDNWVTTNLGDVLAPINGKRLTQRGWSPQCLNHARQSDDQWGVLKTTAIQLGDFQPQHHKELPATLVAKPEIEVVQGDLIMTATGPRNRCGVPCLVTATPSRLMMSGKMFRVRTNAAVCDPRWLLEFLLSDAGQTQLESLKVGSSDSSVSIGADQFERIEMLLPPLNVQLEILGDLDESVARTRAFARAIESTSAQTETLRRSVLHAGFNGQLTNEETND